MSIHITSRRSIIDTKGLESVEDDIIVDWRRGDDFVKDTIPTRGILSAQIFDRREKRSKITLACHSPLSLL